RVGGIRRSGSGELGDGGLDGAEDVGLLVAEVVEVRRERGADDAQLVLRQLDRVHRVRLRRGRGRAGVERSRPGLCVLSYEVGTRIWTAKSRLTTCGVGAEALIVYTRILICDVVGTGD